MAQKCDGSHSDRISLYFSENRYFGAPQLTVHEIDDNLFTIGETNILPIKVMHNKLPVFGYRIGGSHLYYRCQHDSR